MKYGENEKYSKTFAKALQWINDKRDSVKIVQPIYTQPQLALYYYYLIEIDLYKFSKNRTLKEEYEIIVKRHDHVSAEHFGHKYRDMCNISNRIHYSMIKNINFVIKMLEEKPEYTEAVEKAKKDLAEIKKSQLH